MKIYSETLTDRLDQVELLRQRHRVGDRLLRTVAGQRAAYLPVRIGKVLLVQYAVVRQVIREEGENDVATLFGHADGYRLPSIAAVGEVNIVKLNGGDRTVQGECHVRRGPREFIKMIVEVEIDVGIQPRDEVAVSADGIRKVQRAVDLPALKALGDAVAGADLEDADLAGAGPVDSGEEENRVGRNRPVAGDDPRDDVIDGGRNAGTRLEGTDLV